jgi:hypothetical protein
VVAPGPRTAVAGEHDTRRIGLLDGLNTVALDQCFEKGQRAAQLNERQHRYF